MTIDSQVWLGDVIRACRAIAPEKTAEDRATREEILALLGFRTVGQAEEGIATPTVNAAVVIAREVAARVAQSAALEQQIRTELAGKHAPEPAAGLRPLKAHNRLPVSLPPEWASSIAPLPVQSKAAPVLAHEPLTQPGKSRELAFASAAAQAPTGPVDVARLVNAISRGHTVTRLFRQLRWTLKHGVQVLLDLSESTELFRSDQLWLITQLERHVGQERIEVLRFHGCPHEEVLPQGKADPVPYRPPAPGTPVLVLSALGIAGRQGVKRVDAGWAHWAEVLRVRGSTIVALLPYPAARWPQVPRPMRLAAWNRDLVVNVLRRSRAEMR